MDFSPKEREYYIKNPRLLSNADFGKIYLRIIKTGLYNNSILLFDFRYVLELKPIEFLLGLDLTTKRFFVGKIGLVLYRE